MSAKRKSSDNNEGTYQSKANDPAVEEKVDAMMSSERERIKVVDDSEATANEKSVSSEDTEDSVGGAPLLPSDKLPPLETAAVSVKVKTENEAQAADESAADSSSKEPKKTEAEKPKPAAGLQGNTPVKLNDEKTTETQEFDPVSSEQLRDELGLEDAGTNKAVDEIMAAESDELLAARDGRSATASAIDQPKKKRRNLLSAWWHSKAWRYGTLLVVLACLAAVAAIPETRYRALNAAGVRSSTSLIVLDETNGQPIRNAEVSVAGGTATTDAEGAVTLAGLELGETRFVIKKPAFAEYSQAVTIGWGSNPLGEFKLKPVGLQFKFIVIDFLSGKPLAKAEATSGEANAVADDKGELIITVPDSDAEELKVRITADSYRTEDLTLPISFENAKQVEMAPSQRHAFISKRTGTYDLYTVYADGKSEERVLPGTGYENPDSMSLSINPSKNVAAFVSTRENLRNEEGFALSTLTIINLEDKSNRKVVHSERVQLVDWIGDKLIYVKITEGAATTSKDRHKLMSFDITNGAERELASTNYFNDVLAVKGNIYYTPAAYNVNGTVGLYKINPEGNERKQVYEKEVWNLFRTSYDRMSMAIGQEWFDVELGTDKITPAGGPPPVQKTRIYSDNPFAAGSLWVEERDGKGTLLAYQKDATDDKVLQSQAGLKNPVRWLTASHVTYRVSNNQETADYALNLNGGQPKKIRDVTDTPGVDRWYNY